MSNSTEVQNGGVSAEEANQEKRSVVEEFITTNGTDDAHGQNGHAPVSAVNGGALYKEGNADTVKKNGVILEEEEEPDVPDDEENLFISLEEQEKAHAAALEQPKAVEAAPRLLQAALKEGQVKADESEEESDKEKEISPDKNVSSPEPHIHKRVRGRFWETVVCA
jgi:hypothetical protein